MKKSEFAKAIENMLLDPNNPMTLDARIEVIQKTTLKVQKDSDFDQSNKGNAWSDQELKVILQHAPTAENCLTLAKAFKRGYGSIEQIYRWAATSDQDVAASRPDHAFVAQIKRVAKQIGWRA